MVLFDLVWSGTPEWGPLALLCALLRDFIVSDAQGWPPYGYVESVGAAAAGAGGFFSIGGSTEGFSGMTGGVTRSFSFSNAPKN